MEENSEIKIVGTRASDVVPYIDAISILELKIRIKIVEGTQ